MITSFESQSVMDLHVGAVFLLLVVSSLASDVEENIPSVPKCCPLGQTIEAQGGCMDTNLTFEPVFAPGEPAPAKVDLLIGLTCKYGRFRLEPEADSRDEFHLLSTGFLHVPFLEETYLSPSEYCLESFLTEDGGSEVLPLICFPPPPPNHYWKHLTRILYPIGCLISVPFLIATVVVHLFIDEYRGTHSKVLSCYSSCLAVAYSTLAFVQIWGNNLPDNACVAVAFVIEFSFMACFFWLNVMCYHTWRKMTQTTILKFKSKSGRKCRTFMWYSVYGWGCPLVILLVSLIMDLSPTIPSTYIKPNFGLDVCWFQSDKATLSYFYGPISVLLVANVVFFLLTMRYLHVTINEGKIHDFSDVVVRLISQRRRKIFIQCLILFCAMGLNWLLEILSWGIKGPPQMWILTDLFNTLQGVIIFLIFVLRDTRLRNAAWDRFCLCKSRRSLNEQERRLHNIP